MVDSVKNTYYTYLLSDPRNNEPFYVGKGKGRRCNSHVSEACCTNKNSPKLQKIRKILSLGLTVIVQKVEEGVSDLDSQDFEMLLIEECRAKGIQLTNQTAGGDGSSGYKHTPEAIVKIALSQRGVPKPESQKKALSVYLLENPIHLREGVKEKTSGENHWAYGKPINLGFKWTDEQRAAQSERFSGENHPLFGKPCSDERKAAISAATTGVKKSTTINMCKTRSRIECPHCGKVGGSNTMHRWHFDNCKEKPI
jgi:hypothetical protein